MYRIKATKSIFKGCYPSDNIPYPPINFPSAYIINEDDHNKKGSHWICIFVKDINTVNYFDSFAKTPIYNIQIFLNKFNTVISNPYPFQTIFSKFCAHFCIYIIHSLCLHSTYNQVLNRLYNSVSPDFYVQCYVKYLSKNVC